MVSVMFSSNLRFIDAENITGYCFIALVEIVLFLIKLRERWKGFK